jgi:hypothetical protein
VPPQSSYGRWRTLFVSWASRRLSRFRLLPSLSPSVLSVQRRFGLFQRQTSCPAVLSRFRMPLRKLTALHQSPRLPCSIDHALSSTSALRHLGSSLNPPRGDCSRRSWWMSQMEISRQATDDLSRKCEGFGGAIRLCGSAMFAGKHGKLCQRALPKFLFHSLGCFCLWDRLVTHHGSRVGQRDRVGHTEWFAVYQSCGSSGVSRRCSYSLSLIASFNDRGRPKGRPSFVVALKFLKLSACAFDVCGFL